MTPLIRVARSDGPALSICMVLYRGGELALQALAAVAEHTDVPYEVIVVDNCSPDGSGLLVLAGTHGVRYLGNDSNLGFGPAMNQAVGAARAEVVCLLNPDTEVQPGWAAPLLARLGRPGAAAATPLLLERDGATPQEAGGIIDGRGLSHAVGTPSWDDDGATVVGRVVDYASAACLAVRRDAFEAVGGFDPRYRLAYFEDADLAFALAGAGYRMWFEPASRVMHLRGGTDRGGTAIALALENHERFVDKWRAELLTRPSDADDATSRLLLRDWRAPARVAVIDTGDAASTGAAVAAWRLSCPDAVLDLVTLVAPGDERAPVRWAGDPASEVCWWRIDDPVGWLTVRRTHLDVIVVEPGATPWVEAIGRTGTRATLVAPGADDRTRLRALSDRATRGPFPERSAC